MSIPQILIVDDQPDSAKSLLGPILSSNDVSITIRHPRDVAIDDLRRCAVVVVDHYLEDWHELETRPPSMSPRDGFALAAVLRSQVTTESPGPAMAILTGQIGKLAGALPIRAAEHLLAWQHDIEWVFPKSAPQLAHRLQVMADAVESLRAAWETPFELDDLASTWLDLQDRQWRGVALDHILQTRPPIHSVGIETNGSSTLRWFLQRVLPYPSFLTDVYWLAVRLGVTTTWLNSELSRESELHEVLASCAYSGAFAGFCGYRWWRAGIANAIDKLSNGQPFSRDAVSEGVRARSSEPPEFLNVQHPLLALNSKTMEATEVIDADSAVQVAPDGWPSFADSAWAAIEDVRSDPDLMGIVLDPSIPSLRTDS